MSGVFVWGRTRRRTSTQLVPILCLALVTYSMTLARPAFSSDKDWPLWQAFSAKFIQDDGRVIDYQINRGITTSEGQAYALFFSLVANDKARFQAILDWTQANLAYGDLARNLPAWKWGLASDGNWQILDFNSASDADLWLAYTLIQAGRAWNNPNYLEVGMQLLVQIRASEVSYLPDFGFILIPGPHGFRLDGAGWLLNPSYLPRQVLLGLDSSDPQGPWAEIADNTSALLEFFKPAGLASDWLFYNRDSGWGYDDGKGPVGSYDAIRVYLWAGMLSDEDPHKRRILASLHGMAKLAKQFEVPMPEMVDAVTGSVKGRAPAGFSAAVLPFLRSLDDEEAVAFHLARIERKSPGSLVGEHENYYDQVLGLFADGWLSGLYRFESDGTLGLSWSE